MVAMDSTRSPATNGSARAPYGDKGYSMEEAVIVDKAKKTHKETTASAQRAAKVSYLRFDVTHYLAVLQWTTGTLRHALVDK